MKEEGLKAVVKKKKPKLKRHHIKQRLEFAQHYQYWTENDWARVIFSDETKINRLGSDGRQWVWKKSGDTITSQHVIGTVKYGGGSLMIWGCMNLHGVGWMCQIDGNIDAQLYVEILDDDVPQTATYYGMDRTGFIFHVTT